jgi:hypothetical protein
MEARAAADLAAIHPMDHPLARLGRMRLDLAVRRAQRERSTMTDTVHIGTQLRDAAVDPSPSDLLPPTNAGTADPHGPDCVAIEVDDPRRHAAIRELRAAQSGGAA